MCCKRWLETWKGFAVSFLRFFDALSRLCSYVTAFCNHRNGNRQDRKVCLSSFPVRGLGQIINFGNQLLHVKRWYLQLGAVRSCCSFAAAFGDWRNVSLQCVFLLNCSKNAPQSAPNWRNCLRVTASLNFRLIRIRIRKNQLLNVSDLLDRLRQIPFLDGDRSFDCINRVINHLFCGENYLAPA